MHWDYCENSLLCITSHSANSWVEKQKKTLWGNERNDPSRCAVSKVIININRRMLWMDFWAYSSAAAAEEETDRFDCVNVLFVGKPHQQTVSQVTWVNILEIQRNCPWACVRESLMKLCLTRPFMISLPRRWMNVVNWDQPQWWWRWFCFVAFQAITVIQRWLDYTVAVFYD